MSRPHARLRLACAIALAAFGALSVAGPIAAGPAAAAAASPVARGPAAATAASPASPGPAPAADALTPLVDCVQDASLGAVAARTVVLGYRSTASAPLTLLPGSGANDLTAGAADRGQPSAFLPGEHHGVWLLTVDAAAEPEDLSWRLGARTARFDSAPACTSATSVTLAAPTGVVAGATATVSATVTRMLLAAPDAGTVAFALDGDAPVTAPVTSGVARAQLPVAAAGPHSLTATYRPADGSGLLGSAATASFTAAAASAPLGVAADSVVAGSTSVLVTVARASAAGTASVDLMTADGTAHAGADYTPVAQTVTLADGQSAATVRIPLAARAAGSPAATFFVLLQRASTAVTTASATVALPPVEQTQATGPAGPAPGGAAGGPSSVLPPDDPTAAAPSAVAHAGQDVALLLGGVLLTVGGILGVVGLVRAAGLRDARA